MPRSLAIRGESVMQWLFIWSIRATKARRNCNKPWQQKNRPRFSSDLRVGVTEVTGGVGVFISLRVVVKLLQIRFHELRWQGYSRRSWCVHFIVGCSGVILNWISWVEVAGLLKGFLQVYSLHRDRYLFLRSRVQLKGLLSCYRAHIHETHCLQATGTLVATMKPANLYDHLGTSESELKLTQ